MKRKAFFFDRDGVVNKRIIGGYVTNPKKMIFLPHFFEIFSLVKSAGFLTILVTNQQGIGKGLMTETQLAKVHEFMQSELKRNCKAGFDDIYYCPGLKKFEPPCRKPRPGMLLKAAGKWDIELGKSWMLGDSPSDAAAGKKAGANTILVGDFLYKDAPDADFIFQNYLAVKFFLGKIFKEK